MMNSKVDSLVLLCVLLTSASVLGVPVAQPTPQTVAFLDGHQGAKAALSEDGIGAIFGVPLASRGAEANTKDFVDNFLSDPTNAGILGVATLDLAYDNELVISNGKFTVFTYTQTVAEEDNLPMHGGFIRVVVLMGATDKIVHIGAVVKQEPPSALPDDADPPIDPLPIAGAAYPQLSNWSTPEEVVYLGTDDSYHRAWRIAGWNVNEEYMFFVDAATGDLIDVIDTILHGDISGDVKGYATPGSIADDGTSPELVSMPGILVTATGTPPPQTAYAVDNNSLEPAPGTFTIENVIGDANGNADVVSILESESVKVIDFAPDPITDLSATANDVVVGSQAVELRFNESVGGEWQSANTAQVNAFLAGQRTHDWLKSLQPNLTAIDGPVQIEVNNSTPYCDAVYLGNQKKIQSHLPPDPATCGGEPGCDCWNPARNTYLAHEYGHHIFFWFSSKLVAKLMA